jgi:2-keto-4-pentenoate hydratase/2-oxohepta-3-ene-1,7-dioic acid hydratase in catechol pathway
MGTGPDPLRLIASFERKNRPMRYISFRRPDGTPSYGRLESETVVDLASAATPDLRAALAQNALASLKDGATFPLKDVVLLPVIPNPDKVLCVGLNYASHVKETGREQKEHPAIFHRWNDSLIADGQPMVRPPESIRFDYEGELAVIIGKPGRRIAKENAWDHVAGYAAFNDGSVRDWQRHNIQFLPGKTGPAPAPSARRWSPRRDRGSGRDPRADPPQWRAGAGSAGLRHDLGYPDRDCLLLHLHPAQPR